MDLELEALRSHLSALRAEHRTIDGEIASSAAALDELSLRRMKKRKLALKDAIVRMESRLVPDIIA